MSFQTFRMLLLAAFALAVLLPMPACWRLCRRAGLPGWASLVMLIPIVNVAAVYRFAFAMDGRRSPPIRSLPGDPADASHSAPTPPRNRRHASGAGGRRPNVAGARR